jgi:hypothetical protein
MSLNAREFKIESLREELNARSTVEEIDTAREAAERLAEAFGIADDGVTPGSGSGMYERARERIDALEEESATAATAPDGYNEFVSDEYVREAIEDAKRNDSPRYVKGVVAGILQRGGPVSRKAVGDDLGIQTLHHIGSAMRALEARDVVVLDGKGDTQTADFAFEQVEQVHKRQARQQRAEAVMEEL